MNRSRILKGSAFAITAVLFLSILAGVLLDFRARSRPPTPEEAVHRAWQRARDLGAYRFSTELTATAYTAPTLANVGRPSREERLHLEGSVDLPARTLLLSVWQGGGGILDPGGGVEVRIEGDRAYGRQAGGRWQEIDDFSGAFAPAGDLLIYLAGARNVVEMGTETRLLPRAEDEGGTGSGGSPGLRPSAFVQFTRYTFDLNGPALAEHVRQQWQRQLLAGGGAPSGIEVQAPAQLRDSTGRGEVWLDEQGLPARLALEISYPQEEGGQGAGGRATIRTDFSGFPPQAAAGAPGFGQDPAGWLAATLGLNLAGAGSPDFGRIASQGALFASSAGLGLLIVHHRRSRRLYLAIVLVIILSMVVTPLAESQRIAAFGQQQAARRTAYEQRQDQARARQDLQAAMLTSQADPHQDPLDPGSPPAPLRSQPLLGPYQVSEFLAEAETPAPESDLDGDTLTYLEEQRLGTDPDNPDTDGDQLRDDAEVKGFSLGGKTWYTDPLNADSNNDGLADLKECWGSFPLTLPSNQACNLDTDKDGEPDVWDRDNDGDGVPDRVDLSPFSSMATAQAPFTRNNALSFVINDLQSGVPAFVDLQIRPVNPAHLTYALNVLDWPAGDTEGQIQRVLDTTFADGMTEEQVQTDPRSTNGDLRLVPILEIKAPYKAGHTRNLPVKPGWSGTLGPTTPLADWVDMGMLQQYGLTVRYADETGTVVIYAPLSLVSDETGGAPVAFTSRLPYWPTNPADWGKAHQVRFLWAVQMLVDQCKEVPQGVDGESWCAQPANREQNLQIVQTYDESWLLAGYSVREDHGVQMAIAYEDPAHDADLQDDPNLWALANGLDQSWLAGRDCETTDAARPKGGRVGACLGDGERDLTVPEIKHRFDNASNGAIPQGDPRLWNIPKSALRVWTQDMAYQDLLSTVPMTYTQEILNQHFLRNGQPLTAAPTLMFMREETFRIANLDAQPTVMARSGSLLTASLVPELVSLDTLAAMSWAPYRYSSGAWEPYPLDEYTQVLEPRLRQSFPPDPNDPDGQAISDGQVIMARGFYLAMVQGSSEVVESDGEIHEAKEAEKRDEELKEESFEVAGEIVLVIVEVSGKQLVELAYFLMGMPKISSLEELWIWLSEINQDISRKRGGWIGWNGANATRALSVFNRIGIATLIVGAICSTVLFIVAILIDAPALTYVQDGLQVAMGVLRFVAGIGKFIAEVLHAYHEVHSLTAALSKLWYGGLVGFASAARATLVIAIVVKVLVALAVFIYTWTASHVMIGSLAWDQMLVDMIARIVVQALIAALSVIPVIGELLFLLISLLDAVAGLVCDILGEAAKESTAGQWLCQGISGLLTKVLTWAFYGQHLLVDMEDEERWQLSAPSFELGVPEKGLSVGNTIAYHLTLTNSIHLAGIPFDYKAAFYAWEYTDSNLKKSSFAYSISGEEEADLHTGLSMDQMRGEWQPGTKRDGKQTYSVVRELSTAGAGAELSTAGINVANDVYAHEGYALPVQECAGLGLLCACWIRATKATNPVDLGELFLWDVFPEDLDRFYKVAAQDGGYSLAWGQTGDLRFARQKDFDGDALRNKQDGGSDPNDSTWDADGDGLSDYFEMQVGTKPDEVGGYDPDGDGLNDREELLLGTDPFRADTDGDGLTDRQERDGWAFAYGLDAAGKPKTTWVTSDPLLADGDYDTLTDLQEYNFRYHPRAVSDPNVLGFSSLVSERTPSGGLTPTDGLLRSGDSLRYQATVENKTLLSSAQGLLSSRFPASRLSGTVEPRTFLLHPQEATTISGDLAVVSGADSGHADLTQIAGARITYGGPEAGSAQLVLHLEDPITATVFADTSGYLPPRNGHCDGSHCPTRQVSGQLGSGVQFDAGKQQVITVPAADISSGDFGVSFWFKTNQKGAGLFATYDGSVNLYTEPGASGGQVCLKVDVLEWSVPSCTLQDYADDRWHHLALSFKKGDGPNLYVDGEWVLGGYYEGTRKNPNPQSGVRLGYSQAGNLFYSGLLDEVAVYDRWLTWQDVGALYGRAFFAMHLDEYRNATRFAEDRGLAGSCSGTTCPDSGEPGAVVRSARFRGNQNVLVQTGPSLVDKPFTLAAWILPVLTGKTGVDTAPQGIVGGLTYTLSDSFPTLVREGNSIKAAFGSHDRFVQMPAVSDVLTPGAWNHVVVTYDQNQDGKGQFDLYVNGRRQLAHVLPDFPKTFPLRLSFNVGDVWAGSTANPNYPASPFRGWIDEVLIYPYGLSEAQVGELYSNQSVALHLSFDDPPGTYLFQDALGRATGSCPGNLVGCPTAGVTGRLGQAALFDGVSDHLSTGIVLDESRASSPGATMMAWVYPTGGSSSGGHNIIGSGAEHPGWGLWRDGALNQWAVYTGAELLYTGVEARTNQWQHIAAVFDAIQANASFYLNGALIKQAPLGFPLPDVANDLTVGCNSAAGNCFQGRIDEVIVARRPYSQAEIESAYGIAPQFLLHLDEDPGSSQFTDDSGHGRGGSCSGPACPTAGVKGQIGLAAKFDGVDDGILTTYGLPTSGDKTILAWVYPDSTSAGPHMVLSTDQGENAWQLLRDGDAWVVGTGSPAGDWRSATTVLAGAWQHLAAVFSGDSLRFYLNGHPAGDMALDAHNNAGTVAVGYDASTGGARWDGRIDEVAIYERALTDAEVEAFWLYQGQWVQEIQTTRLTVDNDLPRSRLSSDSPYRPNQPVLLQIVTEDDTSAVALAEWRVDSGAWQVVPPCVDVDFGAAWCPTFDPGAFHGPGVYTLHTRATDAAGNVSAASSDPLYVDGSPPSVTHNLRNDSLVRLAPVAGAPNTWSLALSGTVHDPQVATNVAGSGVASVRVTLLDGYGRPAGAGSQLATLKGESWSAEYRFSDPVLDGAYAVQIKAQDQVGNVGANSGTTIHLDRNAPEASLAGLPPGGAMVALHLEEPAGWGLFADSSGYGHDAGCATYCPSAGVDGRYGQAVELNVHSAAQGLAVSDDLYLGASDYTLAVWFQSTGQNLQTLAALSTAIPAHDAVLLQLAPGGKLRHSFSPPGDPALTSLTSPRAFNDGQWHHAAAVRRGSDLLLYADGELVSARTDSRALPGPVRLALGHHGGIDEFQGRLDEAYLVPVAFTTAQVYNLAFHNPAAQAVLSGVVSEVPLFRDAVLELHLEESSGTEFADSSAYGNRATCSGASCPTRTTGGNFGQALHLDGVDDHLSILNSSAFWSLQDTWTLSAWIQPDRLAGDQQILAYPHKSSPGGFGFGIHGTGLRFSAFGLHAYDTTQVSLTQGAWQHVAMVLDGGDLTFFVDGVAREVITDTRALQPNASENDSLFVGMTTAVGGSSPAQLFQGSIDEVYVFDRALSRDEVLALGARRHAGVAKLELVLTPTTPGSPLYDAPLPEGTALYLPFDDTQAASGDLQFLDISGNLRNADCSGVHCPSVGHNGHAGGAALFDGRDDSAYIHDWEDFTTFTVSAWVYRTGANPARETVLSYKEHQGCGFVLSLNEDGRNQYPRLYVRVANGPSAAWQAATQPVSIPQNRWIHLAGTYDGQTLRLYRDGQEVASTSAPGVVVQCTSTMAVGSFSLQDRHFFPGLIDEVVVLSRPLGADEVRSLYLGSGPVLHMPLDEAWAVDGSSVEDTSGFGNDGLLHGLAGDHVVAGVVGSGALQFNGSSDYVATGRSIDFGRGDYTVSAWFRTSSVAQQSLLSATNPSNGDRGIRLAVTSGGRLYFLHRAPTGNSGGTGLTSTASYRDGRWHHAVGVKAGGEVRLYVDGQLAASGSATTAFTHPLDVALGRLGATVAGDWLNGAVDDARIYARALSAAEVQSLYASHWQEVTLNQSGQAVVRTEFGGVPLPSGLEGHYQADLRGWDTLDNRNDSAQSRQQWTGWLDTLPPRAQLQYEITTVGSSSEVHYRFVAQDFSLVEAGLVSPCPGGMPLERTYFNAPWFRAWTGQVAGDTSQLYTLADECYLPYPGALDPLTVCDAAGNCTTVTAEPMAIAAFRPPPEERPAGILMLEPSSGTLLSTTVPMAISGSAHSAAWLRQVTVHVDDGLIYSAQWRKGDRLGTSWATTWTPTGEGAHQIEAQLVDWAGRTYTDTVAVALDLTAPAVALATAVLTSTHLAGGLLPLRGTAGDENGLTAVEAQVDGGPWLPVALHDGTWAAAWPAGLHALPDGEAHAATVRAVDRAGWTTVDAGNLWVDLVPPAPVELDLSYEGVAGTTRPVTRTGTTLRDAGGTLKMAWSAGSDGSGVAGYRIGWAARDADGTGTIWTDVGSGAPRLSSYTPGEAQRLAVSLGSRDAYGNVTWQDFGPIYVDSPLTPDYVAMDDPEGTYYGWMDSGCALLGVDRRLSRVAPSHAMRHGEQALYATWDSQALRLAWTGANWSADGDLFVYLDTVPGGSAAAFDPYTQTATLGDDLDAPVSHLVYFPGTVILPHAHGLRATAGIEEGTMGADYAVWVADAQTAWLLGWDGSAWIKMAMLGDASYRYQPSRAGGLTDLVLPFAWLGIDDPAAASLGLLAFASEEDALRLWAILPPTNPVNSALAMGAAGHMPDDAGLPLEHYYRWGSPGPAVCPNGTVALTAGQTSYADAELQVDLSVEPTGIVYSYLGDNLYPWWKYLLDHKPAGFSSLLDFLDRNYPFLEDGQPVTYTLHIQNAGRETAHGVTALAWADNALTLPGGVSLLPEEHRYFQEVPIGDLAPGEERTVRFQGRVDLAWARPLYDQCLANHPNQLLRCELHLRWALLSVQIIDQAHNLSTGPLERMWADHRVDHQAPRFVGIHSPGAAIAADGATFYGYAYDDSGVPHLVLEVQAPGGATTTLPCPNPAPDSGGWRCQWDPTVANGGVPPQDGDTFHVRLRATDGAGLTGDPGPWQPLVVDTVPPTVTAQLATVAGGTGLPTTGSALYLSGRVGDNRGAAGVEVCLAGACESSRFQAETTPRLRTYSDLPASPLPMAAVCGSSEIRRTFTVTESFSLAGVGFGFRAVHPDRDQIRAELVSPGGTRLLLLDDSGDLSTQFQNYSVLLFDAASVGRHELQGDQDPDVPGYQQLARPLNPLQGLVAEDPAGTWTLVLCNTNPDGESGVYLDSQLFLQPQDTAVPAGTWSHRLPLPQLDGIPQTVEIYGLDNAGNRTIQPWTAAFVVDNVAPALTVTEVISQVHLAPDLTPSMVLGGMVTDGGLVRRIFARIQTPLGQFRSEPAARDGDAWSFAFRPTMPGAHTIRIVAEDQAGNQATMGPFVVEVAGVPWTGEVYLPLILQRAARASLRECLWLPVVLKGAMLSGAAPQEPALPTPSATGVMTPTLTLVPTATLTATLAPTRTLTPTLTVTPTAVLTPTLTLAPMCTDTAAVTPTAGLAPGLAGTVTPTGTVTSTH